MSGTHVKTATPIDNSAKADIPKHHIGNIYYYDVLEGGARKRKKRKAAKAKGSKRAKKKS